MAEIRRLNGSPQRTSLSLSLSLPYALCVGTLSICLHHFVSPTYLILRHFVLSPQAVKPFFLANGFPLPMDGMTPQLPPGLQTAVPAAAAQEEPSGTQSSEGFTSFFASTERSSSDSGSDPKTRTNQNGQADSPQPPEEGGEIAQPMDIALPDAAPTGVAAAVATSGQVVPTVTTPSTAAAAGAAAPPLANDESDTSSMVVLARVKRKHQRKQQSLDRKVSNVDSDRDNAVNGGTLSNAGSVSGPSQENRNEHMLPGQAAGAAAAAGGGGHDNSPSSAQNRGLPLHMAAAAAAAVDRNRNHPVGHDAPHMNIISESSDNLRNKSGFSSTTNTGTNTSGSGGQSGSNPGSSGSGNDQQNSSGSGGNGNGGGSSTDAAKDDNSGGGDTKSDTAVHAQVPQQSLLSTAAAGTDHPTKGMALSVEKSEVEEGTTREQKLIVKRRKRMNKRREYEEQVQQQLASSETSSSSSGEVTLRPGKPVTLDVILSFTRTPR